MFRLSPCQASRTGAWQGAAEGKAGVPMGACPWHSWHSDSSWPVRQTASLRERPSREQPLEHDGENIAEWLPRLPLDAPEWCSPSQAEPYWVSIGFLPGVCHFHPGRQRPLPGSCRSPFHNGLYYELLPSKLRAPQWEPGLLPDRGQHTCPEHARCNECSSGMESPLQWQEPLSTWRIWPPAADTPSIGL